MSVGSPDIEIRPLALGIVPRRVGACTSVNVEDPLDNQLIYAFLVGSTTQKIRLRLFQLTVKANSKWKVKPQKWSYWVDRIASYPNPYCVGLHEGNYRHLAELKILEETSDNRRPSVNTTVD